MEAPIETHRSRMPFSLEKSLWNPRDTTNTLYGYRSKAIRTMIECIARIERFLQSNGDRVHRHRFPMNGRF